MAKEKQVECREFTDAFSKISTMACRHYHRKSDRDGLITAISAIQEPADETAAIKLEKETMAAENIALHNPLHAANEAIKVRDFSFHTV